MAKLLIVESPAKAKTITRYLGSGFQVKASMGHLRDLPKKELGVDVEHDFKATYIPIEGKDKIIHDLKTASQEADFVYLATDPDREGEAISWHLQQLLELQRDHPHRCYRRHPAPTRHRHGPGGRPAGPTHSGSHRGL